MTQPPIKVGTMVMIVNTGVCIDGAVGTVIELSAIGWGHCLCGCGKFGFVRGYGVELPRPIDGSTHFSIPRENLVPITPDGDQADEHASEGLGVGAVV